MSLQTRELYAIPGGDRWLLAKDDNGRVFVRHEANIASGGKVTDMEVGDVFRSTNGPEQQALLHLLRQLLV
jgi:hypothetical protein